MDKNQLASKIDHTLLKPEATENDIRKLCQEALEYQFATVCVRPEFVGLAGKLLQGSKVKPITVIGFPLGTNPTSEKISEAQAAVEQGAQELDMVLQLQALKEKNYAFVYEDILQVVLASKPIPVKVILETGSLTQEQKITAAALAKAAGAWFVKTSTGFAGSGATVEDVELLRRVVGSEVGVKASGGVRNYEDAMKMISAGANRIGTSAGIAIVSQSNESFAKTPLKKAAY